MITKTRNHRIVKVAGQNIVCEDRFSGATCRRNARLTPEAIILFLSVRTIEGRTDSRERWALFECVRPCGTPTYYVRQNAQHAQCNAEKKREETCFVFVAGY